MSHRLTNPFRTDPHPDLSRTIAEIVAPKSKKPNAFGLKEPTGAVPLIPSTPTFLGSASAFAIIA